MNASFCSWVAALIIATSNSSVALASASQNSKQELLIRLNQPQNSVSQAIQSLAKLKQSPLTQNWNQQLIRAQSWLKAESSNSAGWNSKLPRNFPVQIVNEEEGLLKVRLPQGVSLESAIESLSENQAVLNVTRNMLYRPSIHLTVKDTNHSELERESISLSAGLFSALSSLSGPNMPDVLLPSPKKRGTDPLMERDWAMNAIGLNKTDWASVKGKSTITAAVIDTGVDYNHEDLAGGMWRQAGNSKFVGYDFAHNHAKPYDLRVFDIEGCMKDPDCASGYDQSKFLANPGHGTHCAGHVAAVADNSLGMRGVAAGSKIMALKFFYDAGEPDGGAGSDEGAIKSIDFAIKNGAKVINASWGGNNTRAGAEESELKAALIRAQKAGVIVVIAAGNDGRNNDTDYTPNYPASFELDNIITVAATDSHDELADFSAFGLRTVHIGAPGVKILSTIAGGGYDDAVASFKDEDGNVRSMDWDGTSMAAPMVAGAVAAVWSKHPAWTYQQVRGRILASARKVPSLAGKVASGGILNLKGALAD